MFRPFSVSRRINLDEFWEMVVIIREMYSFLRWFFSKKTGNIRWESLAK